MPPPAPRPVAPVLVAVDLSPSARAALLWASGAAARLEAPLLVLHVVHDPAAAPGAYPRTEETRTHRVEEVAARLLSEFVAEVRAEHPELVPTRELLTVGLPATQIVAVAEEHGAQLIVVGSRGRTGLAHILLGSQAQRVAQLSPVPVTIVKARGGDGA